MALTIGERPNPALERMPKTQNFSQVGNYAAIKWSFPNGSSLSATASPGTGKIVFLEQDQDSASAVDDPHPPGLTLGTTTLDDIRRRFGSNGIGFVSNMETFQDGALIGINCYELQRAPGVFVAFATRLAPSGHTGAGTPSRISTGRGVLVTIIAAEKTYFAGNMGLKDRIGSQLPADRCTGNG